MHAAPELLGMFPTMLTQSGYHRRLKTAQPLLCKAIITLATLCPSFFDDLWITDATPVPCGMSRETVKRSDLAGHANYGSCASHSRWYWGLKLYLVCTGDGMPIMWCLANPKIGEREVLAALLDRPSRDSSIWNGTADGTPHGVFTRVAQRLLAMAAGTTGTTGRPA